MTPRQAILCMKGRRLDNHHDDPSYRRSPELGDPTQLEQLNQRRELCHQDRIPGCVQLKSHSTRRTLSTEPRFWLETMNDIVNLMVIAPSPGVSSLRGSHVLFCRLPQDGHVLIVGALPNVDDVEETTPDANDVFH